MWEQPREGRSDERSEMEGNCESERQENKKNKKTGGEDK